jgi:hypothetical protein
MSRPRTKPNLGANIVLDITQPILDKVKSEIVDRGCHPYDCMYHVTTAEAINIPHGYIKVDGTGVSITRRTDYREHALPPKVMRKNMLLFDRYYLEYVKWLKGKRKDKGEPNFPIKPHKVRLTFYKTTKVHKASEDRKEKINEARRIRKANNKANGVKEKVYDLHKRVLGLAMPEGFVKELAAI